MNIIKFLVNKSYRLQYNRDFSDRLEKEQLENEEAYNKIKIERQL